MDPARENPIQTAVEIQGAMLGKHEEELSAARHAVETLVAQMTDLVKQFHQFRLDPPASPRTIDSTEPWINNPPCYSGKPTECRSFFDPMRGCVLSPAFNLFQGSDEDRLCHFFAAGMSRFPTILFHQLRARGHAPGRHPHLCEGERAENRQQSLLILCIIRPFRFFVSVKSQSSPVRGELLASATTLVSPPNSCTTLPIHLHCPGSSTSCRALIDSGAEGNFIDESWALEQGIPLKELDVSTPFFALDGSSLQRVNRETPPLTHNLR